ncbi:MAG: GtrA family protein [Acidobacteriota bacterium]
MNDRKVSALVLSRVLKGKQLHGYFLVGSIAAVIDFTVLFAAVRAGVYYLIANTIAFMSANIFNFLAGHYFVFNKRSRMTNLFHTYAAVLFISIVGLLINNGTLFVAVDLIATDLFAGKVLATIIAFLWNFGARKRWVYA